MALFEAAACTSASATASCWRRSTSRSRRARSPASWVPTAPARRPASTASPARYAPDRGEILFDGATSPACRRMRSRGSASRARSRRSTSSTRTRALDNLVVALPRDARAVVRCLARPRARQRGARDEAMRDPASAWACAARERCARATWPTASGARSRSALALATEPRILFLDEPTSGLGADGTARLRELVAELKRRITLVIIEHDMRFLFGAGRPHQRDPLGPGDRARHAGGAARQPVGAALGAGRARMLKLARIDTYYGETQALFGVSLDVARRRGGGAARPERRRQDHDAALGAGPHACAPRARRIRRPRRHAPAHARDRARGHRLGARRPPRVSRRSPRRATSTIARKRTRFRA